MSIAQRKYQRTPELLDALKKAYTSKEYRAKRKNTPLQIISDKYKIPKASLYQIALAEGLVVPSRISSRAWTEPEAAIVEQYAGLGPCNIARRLHQKGFKRSAAAVVLYMRRNKINGSEQREEQGYLPLAEICRLSGCTHYFLKQLIDKGELKAKPVAVSKERSDGRAGLILVHEKELKKILINYTAHFDFRLADKFWLVDVLTGARLKQVSNND